MASGFKDHFSHISNNYKDFRPTYPETLFQWLADISPQTDSALDCGCGTGQASNMLAQHFTCVYALDQSHNQIQNAYRNEKIQYLVAPAEATGLPDKSQDLILVAQALHWFDLGRFYPEVVRVARKNAIFSAITYGLLSINSEIDRVIGQLYYSVLGNYWPPERRYVEQGYSTLPFPFEEIHSPKYVMTARWSINHLIGYIGTWSAVKEHKKRTNKDPIADFNENLSRIWGDPKDARIVTWPLMMRTGRLR
jgi:ubiquinone/menaquinone biosynthesis C-methylase UbiE